MVIDYKFENINSIINKSRTNPYYANKIKQEETEIARLHFLGKKITNYPITIVFKWHMKSKIADLDNKSEKAILDGMVKAGTIPNDNVKYIQKIIHEYIEDTKDFVEIKIFEPQKRERICMKTNCKDCKYETRCN